ncbi:MAG TPA: tetratricopeptide repeat protein [Pyrinomonadaceae bacterium]
MRQVRVTRRRVLALVLISLSCAAAAHRLVTTASAGDDREESASAGGEGETAIEAASFARAEFFGARALVPYPTAEARNRLADVREKYPDEPQVALRLSQLDEKLGQFDEAERELSAFIELAPDKQEALTTLASFYDRRAQFEKEAATFERLLAAAPAEQRAEIFSRLIELARVHGLENYLKPEFYQKFIEQGAGVFEIIEQLLDKLAEEENYPEALKVLRQYGDRYPERQSYLLKKEVSILAAMKNWKEAEGVYQKAFDPFWPREAAEEFYQFLSDHDRFRAYGHELAQAFARDPADFDTALRLIHYRGYTGERSPRVIAELERARGARRIQWKPEELATLARLLIAAGDGDTASRFIYTLYAQNELKPGSPLREQVLYQLFELLSDARDQRLALTRGDLKFYEDIAASDPHPGMLGGVLSLVLSDTEPARELAEQERRAVRYFNRAAAFRIFTAYKQEYPTSPELAQMYLDIVRLYSATGEPQVAAATLAEFESRYADAPAYAEVALKLADCYVALGKTDEEHALYQRVLDYLGKKREAGERLVPAAGRARADGSGATVLDVYSEPTEVKPPVNYDTAALNRGIYVPTDYEESKDAAAAAYDDSRYTDYLVTSKPPAGGAGGVTYAGVLERYVSSLARTKPGDAVLVLYANELKKYPDEQGLYEQMLQWLGQTNLFDEQLRVYKAALARFPTTVWRDRLARWFLRRERRQEFEAYSRELLAQLNDGEVQSYLDRFISLTADPQATNGGAQLYLGLYTLAHERFPHNLSFVRGLLKFYAARERWDEWRRLMAEYYFTSREIRDEFLAHLAGRNELRPNLERARERSLNASGDARALDALPYKLFRADAAAHLANYEEAIDAYRELNRLYPNTPEFAERLISFTRSLGQHNPKFLEEAAEVSRQLADAFPASAAYRTRAGEVRAELGDYDRARGEWEQLIATGLGTPDTYLETATVYWDYFQYEDALRVITQLRERVHDPDLYAFEAGAILEATHRTEEALAEYVKTLGSADGGASEAIARGGRGKLRLTRLYKRDRIPAQLARAVERERARRADGSALALDYADLLSDAGARSEAAAVLKREIARSNSREFLDYSRNILPRDKDEGVSRLALERLAALPLSPRFSISYRLQLAEDSLERGHREETRGALGELVEKFPTNYGVLDEAENLYWRMGLREDSLRVLESAARRGLGRFHYVFGRKLAARLTLLDRLPQAERVLVGLHSEDKLNTEVFHELARIYLRTSNTAGLKRAFGETLAAIKEQDLDRVELHAQVAALRGQMIDAFTRLKDYAAAVEQHIEIINREPEDEANVEAAIDYAKRYGGADTLLAYYRRTAGEAYKNYRWNVVLARIYEAKNDLQSAAENYKAAIANQPEMVELYDALAQIYARLNNTEGALEALNHAAELTNDDPSYIRRIAELLEKSGRRREAEEARQKLPVAAQPPQQETAGSKFKEAERLRGVERSRAVAAYRQAFDTLLADPFAHELKGAEITGYVQTVRDEEKLDAVAARLWQLRDKLAAEAARQDSKVAGAARASLTVLDGALPEAVGGVAAERGTGDELSALFTDLNRRVEDALGRPDASETLALLQNLCHRAGFGALEEKVLVAQTSSAYGTGNRDLYRQRLQGLVDFYAARGDYRRVIELMEAERGRTRDDKAFDYLRVIASNARAVGDREKELQALRENYRRLSLSSSSGQASATDETVARYLEALYEQGAEGRRELQELAQQASPFQLQLINFMLGRGDGELAHEAIERAPFSEAWKLSRHAGASLALADYGPQSGGYFADALQLKSVGELVAQKPAGSRQPAGDDWFRLAQTYGEWLYQSRKETGAGRPRALLAAMIENRPHDRDEQAKLGRWYLEQKDYEHALAHLGLAGELSAGDVNTLADSGSAAFLAGDESKAREIWSEMIAGKRPELQSCELYLRTLGAHGLAAEAREKVFKTVAEGLSDFGDYEGYEDANAVGAERQKQLDSLRAMIRALSESFGKGVDEAGGDGARATQAESARAEFFYRLSEAAEGSDFLPKTLLEESLVARDRLGPFYELLIRRSAALSSYERDYDYTARLQSAWGAEEAEGALDQETDYQPSEPSSKRLVWERAYLDYLIARREWTPARRVVKAIETEISRRYARPAWLRLATLRLDLADGREAEAVAGLRRFAGVEGVKDSAVVSAPAVERLNMAAAMLREEGRGAAADQLLEAAYTRELALENYSAHAFVGLARLAFARGDAGLGLKLLRTMVALSDEETREEAAAEVASWPAVKASAADRAKQEGAETENTLDRAAGLRLAAETASVFAQFNAAADYRRRLSELSPEDETNRLELARVLSAKKDDEEAVRVLAEVIGDRRATRRARWQAVRLAPEIAGARSELWGALKERVRAINAGDDEMLAALTAASAAGNGTDEAGKLIRTVEASNPNPYLTFFGALLESKEKSDIELTGFLRALVAGKDARVEDAFGFAEEGPLRQIIRFYAAQGQPRAALLAYTLDPTLKEGGGTESDEDEASGDGQEIQVDARAKEEPRYMTLRERAAARELQSRRELLRLLSEAAERTEDLGLAVEFERARLKLLPAASERQAAEARIAELLSRQKEDSRRPVVAYSVDQNLIARR